ncbi:MAG: hypothetical protein QM699_00010 [Amaricoccus sp.]|uniref:hypothetical protein n=1 Tax=Amaricoccus sp. TaxID=1872485 RepID=UPI0039E45A7B
MQSRNFAKVLSLTAAFPVVISLTLTGCGAVNSPITTMLNSGSATIAGKAHGGPNPVIGATVTLYATQSNGYGGAGLQLAQTTTASDGSFTFNPLSYTCPAVNKLTLPLSAGIPEGTQTTTIRF